MNRPLGATVDAAGNLLIADQFNDRIRRVSGAGPITTFAGGGFTQAGLLIASS